MKDKKDEGKKKGKSVKRGKSFVFCSTPKGSGAGHSKPPETPSVPSSYGWGQFWPTKCRLAFLRITGGRATGGSDFGGRCRSLSCPACSRYGLQGDIRAVVKVNERWSLPGYVVTVTLGQLRRKELDPKAIDRMIREGDRVASALADAPGVLALFSKPEMVQAAAPEVPGAMLVEFQLRAVMMTEKGLKLTYDVPDDGPAVHIVPLESLEQIEELRRPYIIEAKDKWNKPLLAKLIDVLNDWQKMTERTKLTWRTGLYDGHQERWAREAMELLDKCEKLPPDTDDAELEAVGRKLRRSVAVKKWRRFRKYYHG